MIVIGETGLIPTRIAALGIEFSASDQRSIVVLLSLSVLFLGVAFAIYATVDVVAYLRRVRAFETAANVSMAQLSSGDHADIRGMSLSAARIRVWFDFVVPLLIAVYAIGRALLDAPVVPL